MMQIEVGDVVRLKSGGPSMTVMDITPEGEVKCEWFSGDDVSRRVFLQAQLERDDGGGLQIISM